VAAGGQLAEESEESVPEESDSENESEDKSEGDSAMNKDEEVAASLKDSETESEVDLDMDKDEEIVNLKEKLEEARKRIQKLEEEDEVMKEDYSTVMKRIKELMGPGWVSDFDQPEDMSVHQQFLQASQRVLELINMGKEEVAARYPLILCSLKNASQAITVLIRLQEQLIPENRTISITNQEGGTSDIDSILLDLQKMQFKLEKVDTDDKKGKAKLTVKYDEEKLPNHQHLLDKMDQILDNYLSKVISNEGTLMEGPSTFAVETRNGQAFQIEASPTCDDQGRKCIWKREMDKLLKKSTNETQQERASESPQEGKRSANRSPEESAPTKKRKNDPGAIEQQIGKKKRKGKEKDNERATRQSPRGGMKKPQRYTK
jgi:hypothetical protein